MYNSRDRVLCALGHEEPDRVPVFFGTSGVTSMLTPAYEQLKNHLGIQKPTREISRIFQYALLDEEIMERFGSDGRPLLPGPAPSIHSRDVGPDAFVDEWGIEWRRRPGAIYNEAAGNPLRDLAPGEIDRYAWPELSDLGRFSGVRQEATRIRGMNCAVVALPGVAIFEHTLLLRGMETFLVDMASDRDFAGSILGTVARLEIGATEVMLREAGDLIDVLVFADDLGTQNGLMISPAMYRSILKPLHAQLIATIRAHSKAKVFMHSDGDVFPVLDDLIDVGVDILNPVQVSAGQMGDTARLKRRYGDRLSFCGGIDTNWVLPHGTPEDVRREVRRRIADLGPGGGYILASVHCLQPDVPIPNTLAMFDEAGVAGRYPLRV
jgi:uroporphyrinogen decarboxylase